MATKTIKQCTNSTNSPDTIFITNIDYIMNCAVRCVSGKNHVYLYSKRYGLLSRGTYGRVYYCRQFNTLSEAIQMIESIPSGKTPSELKNFFTDKKYFSFAYKKFVSPIDNDVVCIPRDCNSSISLESYRMFHTYSSSCTRELLYINAFQSYNLRDSPKIASVSDVFDAWLPIVRVEEPFVKKISMENIDPHHKNYYVTDEGDDDKFDRLKARGFIMHRYENSLINFGKNINWDKMAQDKRDRLHYTIALSLCYSISLLHSRGIAHRDIKPGNILIDKIDLQKEIFQIVLCDFGLAKQMGINCLEDIREGDIHTGNVITEPYRSPEVSQYRTELEKIERSKWDKTASKHEKIVGQYGLKSDVWSMGIVLLSCLWPNYPMISQIHKMYAHNVHGIIDKILDLIDQDKNSSPLVFLLRKMLCRHDKRFTSFECVHYIISEMNRNNIHIPTYHNFTHICVIESIRSNLHTLTASRSSMNLYHFLSENFIILRKKVLVLIENKNWLMMLLSTTFVTIYLQLLLRH